MSKTYEKNVCAMLRHRGLSLKYEHPGIYCIKLDGQIVYIGKDDTIHQKVDDSGGLLLKVDGLE